MCQQLIGDIKHVKKYGNFTSVLSWLFLGLHILAQHSSLYNKYMLFARQEVCIEKKLCPRSWITQPRAVLKTEGTVFPNTDRPRLVNCIFFETKFFLWKGQAQQQSIIPYDLHLNLLWQQLWFAYFGPSDLSMIYEAKKFYFISGQLMGQLFYDCWIFITK